MWKKCDSHFFQMAHLTTSTNFFNMLGHICKLQAHKSWDVTKTHSKQSILWANVTVKKVTYVTFSTDVTFLTVTVAQKIDCFKWILDTSRLLCAWSLQMCPNRLQKFVDVVKCAIWKKCESHIFHICESHLWFTFFYICCTFYPADTHLWMVYCTSKILLA